MTLRILYSIAAPLGGGGIGRAAAEQVKSLIAAGCEVEVICASSPDSIPGAKVVETLRWLGVRIPFRVMGVDRSRHLHDWLAARYLRQMPVKPDIVHVWPPACELTLEEARRLDIVAVREAPNTHTANAYEVVGREHARLGVPPSGSHAYNPRRLAAEEREYALADVILVPSELARETFRDRGIDDAKLVLKNYGFDPQKYAAVDKSGRAAPVTFAFIATCEPRKGLHIALEAWHRSGVADSTRMMVLGKFAPGYRAYCARWLGHPNVSIVGYVNDLAPIYADADVLMLPSIEEGSALVTYEAQGAGCALLVSRAAGARFVSGEQGFEHEPGDVATLARHIATLATDVPLLRKMQAAAAVNARSLTWDRATVDLIAAYDYGIARKRKQPYRAAATVTPSRTEPGPDTASLPPRAALAGSFKKIATTR